MKKITTIKAIAGIAALLAAQGVFAYTQGDIGMVKLAAQAVLICGFSAGLVGIFKAAD